MSNTPNPLDFRIPDSWALPPGIALDELVGFEVLGIRTAPYEEYSTRWEYAMEVRDQVKRRIFSSRACFIRGLQHALGYRMDGATLRGRMEGTLVDPDWMLLHVEPIDICRAALYVIQEKGSPDNQPWPIGRPAHEERGWKPE